MIIGVAGYAQVGKDTTADFLVEHCGYEKVSFANVMREALLRLDPLVGPYRLSESIELYGWDKAKVVIPEIRRLLQRFGTEVGRDLFGDTFWVDYLFSTLDEGKNYVIADCRYLNEVTAIRDRGGELWWVARPDHGPLGHRSETELTHFPFDVRLMNDGAIEDLHNKIGYVLGYEKEPCAS
jgi:hypothetical protein